MAPVYTLRVAVRHHELDRFGRLHPGVYLRYLAHAAVRASEAAGFDAAWYAAAGARWIVRRSTLDVARPVGGGQRLAIRTWVEDFRRVRSHRRYELRDVAGALCAEARTDWVYVDAATGRPRRVPPAMQAAFAGARVLTEPRDGWKPPPRPVGSATTTHRVCAHELDALGHVNNAVYLEWLAQAVLDTLDGAGWPLDRLAGADSAPVLTRTDLEYREPARYGDRLDIATWFTPVPGALDAHQVVVRRDDGAGEQRCVGGTTRWRFGAADAEAGPPAELVGALLPLVAA